MKSFNTIGKVHSLETFGSVDGPGVRFVIFLQGCKMRCKYCHNPETWSMGGEEWTPKALFERAYRYRSYWGKGAEKGGITVSGGEPLLQMEFVTELFELAKQKGVHTALDTSGQPFCRDEEFLEKFDRLMSVTDLVILDLKEMDSDKHKALCGFHNENILDMARYLSDNSKPLWLRHVLVPGVTDYEKGLYDLARFSDGLKTVLKKEILPYHTLGLFKWEKLGIAYPLEGVRTPTAEEVKKAESIFCGKDIQ